MKMIRINNNKLLNLFKLNNRNFNKNQLFAFSSQKAASSPADSLGKKSIVDSKENLADIDCDESIKIISTKIHKKLPARKPLAKNFFLGNVDKELLAFPEVIPREDLAKLNEELSTVRKYFESTEIDAESIEKTHCIPNSVTEKLKSLKLLGINLPQSYGGCSYSFTESLIASQPEIVSESLSARLISHRLVSELINTFGTDYQKEKYLQKLANGSIIASEAIFESELSSNKFFNTIAEYEEFEKEWKINGEKSFVIDGKKANLYLVLAETKHINISGENVSNITMFLVDSSKSGVTTEGPLLSLGCKAAEYCKVKFSNVILTNDDVIGEVNNANKLVQNLLKSQRLHLSLIGLNMAKKVINNLAKHCIETKQCGVFLKDMNLTSNRLADLICKAYAMESMIYYTSGLIDEFENQDVDLEAALTKVYAMENFWNIVSSGMDFMGPTYILSGNISEILFKNAAQLYTTGESVDALKIFIALCGLQHAGMNIYETVKKERNPLFHPGHVFSKFFQSKSMDSPNTNMLLDEHLHPTLKPAAQCLEHSIYRLQICTNILLRRYGNEIIEKHVEMRRLSEMIILIYAMFTSLSRASRAYCIGLKLADHEVLLATTISLSSRERIKTLATEIEQESLVTSDRNMERLSKQIWKSKGYYPENPVTYNF